VTTARVKAAVGRRGNDARDAIWIRNSDNRHRADRRRRRQRRRVRDEEGRDRVLEMELITRAVSAVVDAAVVDAAVVDAAAVEEDVTETKRGANRTEEEETEEVGVSLRAVAANEAVIEIIGAVRRR